VWVTTGSGVGFAAFVGAFVLFAFGTCTGMMSAFPIRGGRRPPVVKVLQTSLPSLDAPHPRIARAPCAL
jgi:hypothetical protein